MPTAIAALRRELTSSWLNLLLLAAPVSRLLALGGGDPSIWTFAAAALALVPAAGLIGGATAQLSRHAGPTLGGFLNATFGNAAELIIAIAALRSHHTAIVKASITGSILGNLLFVFGLSCFIGGLRHGPQRFNRTGAGATTVMLFLAVVALVMPAVVDLVSFGSLKAHPAEIDRLSLWTSIVLLIVYAAGLVFSFRSRRLPEGGPAPAKGRAGALWPAIALLALATVLTTIEAEILIAAIGPALRALSMTELFAGVVVIAFVGNAAEHYSALSAAADNDMTLAFEISVGSSAQIATTRCPCFSSTPTWDPGLTSTPLRSLSPVCCPC